MCMALYLCGRYGKVSKASMKDQRESLPIFQLRAQLVRALKENQILVVVGETGSGKTTQMTQYVARRVVPSWFPAHTPKRCHGLETAPCAPQGRKEKTNTSKAEAVRAWWRVLLLALCAAL
jgi:hypothetical protein